MTKTSVTALAFAALCLGAIGSSSVQAQQIIAPTETWTNGPQANRGDLGNWSTARNNVVASERYDQLLQANPGFRHERMRRECGPIIDSELRASCLSSFGRFEPSTYGSSTMPRTQRPLRNIGE